MVRAAIITTAGRTEGRGHAARARVLAEALIGASAAVSVSFRTGGPTPSEERWYQAHAVSVYAAEDADVAVVDLPEPRAADVIDPARTAVFDDRERFDGQAAIVVQPSLPSWHGSAEAGQVLAGWAFAPVGAAWRAARAVDGERPAAADRPRVVVCFGGSDPDDVTARLGPVLAARSEWLTTVVVGADYAGLAGDTVRDPADLPGLVGAADLVVCGAGTMKFEVAASGRPAILLAAADDQLAVGPPFAATGAALWLGDGRTIEPKAVVEAMGSLLDRPDRLASMRSAAAAAVDGRGAERIADAVVALAPAGWAGANAEPAGPDPVSGRTAGPVSPDPDRLWSGPFGDAYVERNRTLDDRRRSFWDHLLTLVPITSALEVGCGQGGNLRWLVDRLPPGETWGLDVNEASLERAAQAAPGARLIRGTARSLPFADRSFDLVFTVGVLIHQPDEDLGRVMDEVVRCSRRYVLAAEYHADEIAELRYHGQAGALFKRPYGRLYQERHPDLTLVEEGFLDQDAGFDRVTYQLFERPDVPG